MGGRSGAELNGQLLLFARGQRRNDRARLSHQAGHGHGLSIERHAAGLNLGQVQDVVDQRQQVPAAGIDVVQIVGLFRRDRPDQAVADQLAETDDSVERRAQFVAHVGQELALQAIEFLQPIVGGAYLFQQADVLNNDGEVVAERGEQLQIALGESIESDGFRC